MTDAQRIQLAAATARKELRALALNDDATAEDITTATAKVDDLEARAAVLTAAEKVQDGPDQVTTEDAEARELRALQDKVEVRSYLGAALDGAGVDGAEREYNAALGMGAGSFPLRLLAPERETRATTDTDAGANQGTWLDRLFADTAAMHLGISFRQAGAGVASYPVTTAGASAAQRGRGEDAADAAWTIGVTEAKPSRNQVRAVFSVEDAARLQGLDAAISRDLRMALSEGIDRAVFLGDSGANEDRADITGLNTAAITEVTLTQAAKVKYADWMAKFAGMIDGKSAASQGDLRVVLTVGANTLLMSTIANSNRSETMAQVLRGNGISWRVRGDIEAATTAGKFGAFVGLGRGIEGAAVAPVWGDSARLIRDPYSGAASGEIALNLVTMWNLVLPRAANFRRLKFVA